jgi:hypothetical protein
MAASFRVGLAGDGNESRQADSPIAGQQIIKSMEGRQGE